MRRHSLELQSSEWQSEPPLPETSRSDHSSPHPRAALSSSLFWYLVQLTPARVALWSYLIWYLVVLVRHFEAAWTLWLNSIGISAIVGTALYLNTAHTGCALRLERWQVFRLYLSPFCVSSFASLIKGRGFVLVFHPTLEGNLTAATWVVAFHALVFAARRVAASRTRLREAAAE